MFGWRLATDRQTLDYRLFGLAIDTKPVTIARLAFGVAEFTNLLRNKYLRLIFRRGHLAVPQKTGHLSVSRTQSYEQHSFDTLG